MNHVIRTDFDDGMVYITCHTDGEPDGLFWVWEVVADDLDDYFNGYFYRADVSNLTTEDAETFINDSAILENSDEYECGKSPIYGCWYAPLTMEQIEQAFG